MIRIAIVGLGKMGLSHLAIARAHPDVEIAAVCDSTTYLLDVLHKYTGVATFTDFEQMLNDATIDAVIIATPTNLHSRMVEAALERGLHVFCEKPLALSGAEGGALVVSARRHQAVTQVGYHNRFIASFAEVRSLLDAGAIGRVTHAFAEAYGPVVLKPKGGTWRSVRSAGGGCLYDYAAHPLDLLTWYLGPVGAASGSTLGRVFSRETEDEVYTSLAFAGDVSAQLSVSWSDESQRKMSTAVTLWGTGGKIRADRQEIQVYRRAEEKVLGHYGQGWTVRYTTELTPSVWFYLRGEEYSAQIDSFVRRVQSKDTQGTNSFASAVETDRAIDLIREDAVRRPPAATVIPPPGAPDDVVMAGAGSGSRMSRSWNRLASRRSR